MEPTTLGLITAAIPFVTSAAKKVFHTERLEVKKRKGLNALLPVLIGVLSSGLYAFSQGQDPITALAIGLGSGGVAASARNVEKNLVRLTAAVAKIVSKPK